MIYLKNFFNFFKNSLNKEAKLVNLFLTQVILVTSLMFVVVIYFWIKGEYSNLKEEISATQKEYIESQKENIKKETERAISYINYKISQTDDNIKKKLKNRVNLAYNIAANIYNENKNTASSNEIKNLIITVLRPIRFDNGRGYYFIGSLDGYDVLFPVAPEHEGKYIYNLQDDLGNYVIQDELKVINSKEEGFVTNYWTRPGSDTSMAFKKLSYVKLFKPLNWYIGTGDYYIDFTTNVQEEVLDWLSNYRFDSEGYIFVNTYDGDALLMDGEIIKEKKNIWNLEDPNGTKVIQEERKAVKNPDGDFIYYSWRKLTNSEISHKMSFVKGIPGWRWMVGAGVYIEDMNQVINTKNREIKKSINRDILIIIIYLSILFVLLYLFALYLSKKATNNIDSFIQFFKNASYKNILIDESKIHFSEFKALAKSANKMITEIKKSEVRNQEKEAHSEKLFEESPEAIVFVNNEGQVQRINAAFTKLFGFENSEIINQELDDFIVPEELKEQALIYTKKFKEGFNVQIEAIRKNKNKQKVHVSIIGTPISVNRQLFGYYVIYRNISEQKEFEQQLYDSKTKAEESDRLKSSFLTNLSHEIRTPLNAIMGFSTLLNTKEVSKEDQKEYLRILANSGKLLLEIIDNIIDISKVESSTLTVNKNKSNLNTMLDELLIDFLEFKNNMDLDKIDITLQKEIDDKELYILTDLKRLKQVYSNLLENALKFTEKGKVEFGYYIKGQEIICFVKDSGIGINENEINFIFDRFRQADESTTRKYGGTGIGLALCKSLVELLGGKLWVESKKGEGANFYFAIPYDVVKPDKKILIKPKIVENIDWSNKKVLIAEDVETNYKLLFSFLSKTKVKIYWAKDGKEAVDLVEKNPDFDLILMDINMPIMTGHEALKHLINKGYNMPVIAQTAYATEEQRYDILDLGYSDYILKPITFQSLLQKLSKFLD
ncbi:MAG: cache domain-containing protein [Bacteroidales bacterium]|nr:cache domain-containing protein [Bacteroidales bacterium]